jgi:hypothetical protein
VVHSYVDQDGALVEITGRKPYEFSCKIPFINNLNLDGETVANLTINIYDFYPDGLLQFKTLLHDGSTGIFHHPLYGDITCKPVLWHEDHNPKMRGGVIFNVEFMETSDNLTGGTSEAPTGMDAVLSFAAKMDALHNMGLTQQVQSLQTLTPQQLIAKAAGLINTVSSTVQTLQQAQQGNFSAIGAISSSLTGQNVGTYIAASNGLINSLNNLQNVTNANGTKLITTTQDMTLAQFAQSVSNTVSQIQQLNPTWVGRVPIIPRGTTLAYAVSPSQINQIT